MSGTSPRPSDVGGIAGEQLRAIIDRIERLEEEKKALTEDIADVYAEAAGNGFDKRIIRKIVALRKRDRDEVEEEDTMLEVYMRALGMLPSIDEENERETPTTESRAAKRKTLRKRSEPLAAAGVVLKATTRETAAALPPGTAGQNDVETARALVRQHSKASASFLQRRLGIGYAQAAVLIEQLQVEGTVSAPDAAGKRYVLPPQNDIPQNTIPQSEQPNPGHPSAAPARSTVIDSGAQADRGDISEGGVHPARSDARSAEFFEISRSSAKDAATGSIWFDGNEEPQVGPWVSDEDLASAEISGAKAFEAGAPCRCNSSMPPAAVAYWRAGWQTAERAATQHGRA